MTAREESPLIVALGETVEIRTAQRDRAMALLDRVDKLIPRASHLGHLEQRTLREAHALLVECGVRKGETDQPWVDRECTCPPRPPQLADGTNATVIRQIVVIDPACALHGERL